MPQSAAFQSLLWTPTSPQDSMIAEFIRFLETNHNKHFTDYESLHRWSVEDGAHFWSTLWDFAGIIGDKGKTIIHQTDHVPWARFFPDSKISYAENMLASVTHKPHEPAIIYRLQNKPERIFTWEQLYNEVSRWQQALEHAGVGEGDRVAVYLPNVPEAIIILLAVSNIGAVFASAGMEMGQSDLVNRFSQVKPKILITADGYVHGPKEISRHDVVQKVQQDIPSLQKTVVIQLLEKGSDLTGLANTIGASDFLHNFAAQKITFTRRAFNHPLYILFSSGSTGKPKCFEHSTGGVFLKHVSEHLLNCDIKPGDRVFYHATPSWMMWNWLVSALAMHATILIYDGSPAYPDAYAQWDFTSAHECTHHGTAAPVILSWAAAKIEPFEKYELTSLRMVLSTGAVLPAQGFEFIHKHVKHDVKISSISGGTDIVGCFLGGNALAPTYAGQINGPMMGMDVRVLDEEGKPVADGEAGELVCTDPFPSMPLRFLDDDNGARYRDAYFDFYPENAQGHKHLWRHGDTIQKTPQGQFVIVGRSDATLNQNGVRIGTGAIYDQLTAFQGQIKEAAAIDFSRPDNQQTIIVLFLALDSKDVPEDLAKSIKTAVKNNVGPYSVPTEIIAVPGVLKTPNGKIAEVVMKKVIAGKSIPNASLYGEDLVKHFEEIGRALQKKYA